MIIAQNGSNNDQEDTPVSQAGRDVGVCIVSESFYPNLDGGAVCSRLLAEQLYDAGTRVFVVTRRNLAAYPREEKIGKVVVYRVGPYDRRGVLGRYMAMFTILWPVIRNRQNFDSFLVSNIRILGAPVVILAKLLGKKCVARTDSCGELSGSYVLSKTAQRSLRRFLISVYFRLRNLVLWRADVFVAISKDIAREFREEGIPDRRIRIIPNGVDTDEFAPIDQIKKSDLRSRLELPQNQLIVVYSGRFTKEKGLLSLIRTWKTLAAAADSIHLLLVGSGQGMPLSCEDELRSFVGQNGLDHTVTFTGPVDNVAEFLQCADIFVFPSQTEALGLALIEAQSCGLPAVGSNVGGIPDIIETNVNGILVEPNNDRELHDALLRLISDSAARTGMGRAGRQTVLRNFQLEHISEQYIMLFDELRQISRIDGQ